MKWLISAFIGAAIFTSMQGHSMDIAYSKLNPFGGSVPPGSGEGLVLKGEIVPGDYDALLDVIRANPERFWHKTGFILASPGGDVQEALKIARLVKGTYSPVFVGKAAGPCVSACFFIYVSAVTREAGPGQLGVHRPYINPSRLSTSSAAAAEVTQDRILRQARAYLEDQNVPTNLIDKMFQRASTEVYWLSTDEIENQLGRRPPWFEQYLIAKCGLDKQLERDYFQTNNRALLPQILAVESCGDRLSKGNAEAFLESELSREANH